jgi:hypothetical protein
MEVSIQLHVPAVLPPGKESNWIGFWVGPKTGLDAVQKRKILHLLGIVNLK